MSYPGLMADNACPPVRLGAGLAVGIAAGLGRAAVVGVSSGVTGFQSAYAAILLGWIVGLAVSPAGRKQLAAAAAAVLSLAGVAARRVSLTTFSSQ
jgi:hypothetical protein